MLIYIIIIMLAVYTLLNLWLQYGLSREPVTLKNYQPTVSVLIAARNEEKSLALCLESISRLDYPAALLEVLILDDHSTDTTALIARSFTSRYKHFKLIDIKTLSPGLLVHGKMNALAQGIEASSGEIILVTDADCTVPPGWVSGFAGYFAAGVGLAGGMTLLNDPAGQGTCFKQIQSLDWIFLQGIAAGTAALALPVTVLGNNFGFRRRAYLETGGFAASGFSLAEDMQLLQAIHGRGWKVAYPLQAATAVSSLPLATLRDFYRQRLRWVKSSSTASWWGYVLMSAALSAHLAMLLAVIFNLLNITMIALILTAWSADFIFLLKLLRRFGLGKLLAWFPLFEVFYILYTLVFAVLFFLPARVIWKERNYK